MDLANVNAGFGPCALYSPTWTEAYLSLRNEDWSEARRQIRRVRLASGQPTRIAITLTDTRDREVDSIEVYGWRAAMVAIRAMGADREARTDLYQYGGRVSVFVCDALLSSAIEGSE